MATTREIRWGILATGAISLTLFATLLLLLMNYTLMGCQRKRHAHRLCYSRCYRNQALRRRGSLLFVCLTRLGVSQGGWSVQNCRGIRFIRRPCSGSKHRDRIHSNPSLPPLSKCDALFRSRQKCVMRKGIYRKCRAGKEASGEGEREEVLLGGGILDEIFSTDRLCPRYYQVREGWQHLEGHFGLQCET